MKETELAQHFVEYLSCYDLYFEVDYGGCVDIVAINGNVSMSYEVKNSFNFKVLEQAIRNTRNFNYSYIAVPFSKDRTFQEKLCSDYGVGILYYDKDWRRGHSVKESVPPKLNRLASAKKLMLRLSDINKRSKPGAKSGDGDKITAFSVTVDALVLYVQRHQGCKLKEAIDSLQHHYYDDKSAYTNLYRWIQSGVINRVRLENGKLFLNKQ